MTDFGTLAKTVSAVLEFEQIRLTHFDLLVDRILAQGETPALDFTDYRVRLAHLREVQQLLCRMAARERDVRMMI